MKTEIKLGDFALYAFHDKPTLWKVSGKRIFMHLHIYTLRDVTNKDMVELSGNQLNALQAEGRMIIYPYNI